MTSACRRMSDSGRATACIMIFFLSAMALLLPSTVHALPTTNAIMTAGESLTAATWSTSIQEGSGTWLVEHYSPYCAHCRAFAPKWSTLVSQMSLRTTKHNFHFAQVDCSVSGDLCHEHNVKYYPSLFLYVNGEFYDEYMGKRDLDQLEKYVEDNLPGLVTLVADDEKEDFDESKSDTANTGKGGSDNTMNNKGLKKIEHNIPGATKKGGAVPGAAGIGDILDEDGGLMETAKTVVPVPLRKGKGEISEEEGDAFSDKMKSDKVKDDDTAKSRQKSGKNGDEDSDGHQGRLTFLKGTERTDSDKPIVEVLLGPLPPAEPVEEPQRKRPKIEFPDPKADARLGKESEATTKKEEGDLKITGERTGGFAAQQPAGAGGSLSDVEEQKKRNLDSETAQLALNAVSLPKSDGEVHTLDNIVEQMKAIKSKGSTATFIKYFAPWCGHCKSLAPRWQELAKETIGKVRILEVDCEEGVNRRICREEGVKAYPTLIFYTDGEKMDYNGGRAVDTMKTFAMKIQAATKIEDLANEYELKRAASAEEVIVLFLYPKETTTKADQTLASDAAKTLLGEVPFYTSSSPSFFSQYKIAAVPTLLVFKDKSTEKPISIFTLPNSTLPSKKRYEETTQWLRSAKLPTLTEITSTTFQDVMPSKGDEKKGLYAAIAILNPKSLGTEGMEKAKAEVRRLAEEWRIRQGKRILSKKKNVKINERERDVVWAWIDQDKWSSWTYNLFRVDRFSDPVFVISDPIAAKFWKTSIKDGKSVPASGESVFDLIENGIWTGTAKSTSMKYMVERFGDSVRKSTKTASNIVVNHPLLSMMATAAFFSAVWTLLRWCLTPTGHTQPKTTGPNAKRE